LHSMFASQRRPMPKQYLGLHHIRGMPWGSKSYKSRRHTKEALEIRRRLAILKTKILAQLEETLRSAPTSWHLARDQFRGEGGGRFDARIGRCLATPNGHLRWKVKTCRHKLRHSLLIIRLQPDNSCLQDFVLLREVPRVVSYFTLSDAMVRRVGKICHHASELAKNMTEM